MTTITANPTRIHDLILLIGPEALAEEVGPPTPEEEAAIAAFGARLNSMSNEQVRIRWGFGTGELIVELRDLFAS
jgi:hypothetical protein